MKRKYWFVFLMLAAIFCVSTALTAVYVKSSAGHGEKAEFTVVTSFYPMYIAAENIIGDTKGVALSNLSEPQTGCLHDFQLTPADMKQIAEADVFIINGGGLEGFLTEIAAEYPNLEVIDASKDLMLSAEDDEDGQKDREEQNVQKNGEEQNVQKSREAQADHEHEEENAHVWMSVALYRKQVAAIADALAKSDPKHAEDYHANAAAYDAKLAELQQEQEEIRTLAAGQKVILFHEAYEYIAGDYDMQTVTVMDLDEERQISAGEAAEVLKQIRLHEVKLILAEETYGKDMGDTVMAESEVTVLYLDTLNRGDYRADSYLTGMRENMEKLRAFFRQ